MIQFPTCPVCHDPVVDQPASDWTSAYRGRGGSWWHLANDRPICPDANGNPSPPAFVEDHLPIDSETSSWLETMADLFAIDGPYSPARLGSALTAAEHLNRWLHTATGPFSALLSLDTTADVASLIGYLHRTSRLLARVHVQTGSHLLDQARETSFTGLDDSGSVSDAAADIQVWLRDAAAWSAESARATGIAWARAHTLATPTRATSPTRTDQQQPGGISTSREGKSAVFLRGLVQRFRRWVSPGPATRGVPGNQVVAWKPLDMSPDHLAELIGSTFGHDTDVSAERASTAARILEITATYLVDYFSPTRSAAVPTPRDLTDLAVSLTPLLRILTTGLRHLADSPQGIDSYGLDHGDATAIQETLTEAAAALRFVASNLLPGPNTAGFEQRTEEQR
ncbi:hypothetical protein FJK98_31895 [Micromonospora sp. HM134]|uniref:hypothetical protein n=1 Tax=Micromonospora sp. HM134 TaxID=2583243 RepID=UPI001198B99A|nr:hypothetical protein [Micromonospora sp. HM134]QDY11178.1 hypothetical protein FJK98_31895 [Micromonospora sp. HM134]